MSIDPTPQASPHSRLTRAALVLWALATIAVVGSLMVTHTYALPRPASDDPALRAAVEQSRLAAERGRWLMLHVMYSRCRCSRRILDHLVERGARSDVSERIVLVEADEDFERRARGAGYQVEVVTPTQLLERYTLSAAPALVIAAPTGSIRYLGGYSERKQGVELRDVQTFERVRKNLRSEELPLFGCAVSQSLRELVDPLGLKSLQEE